MRRSRVSSVKEAGRSAFHDFAEEAVNVCCDGCCSGLDQEVCMCGVANISTWSAYF